MKLDKDCNNCANHVQGRPVMPKACAGCTLDLALPNWTPIGEPVNLGKVLQAFVAPSRRSFEYPPIEFTPGPVQNMGSLPTDAAARKAIPIYSGFIAYFPDAIVAVAALSQKGNDQHNPGKPLHWDRSKSGDEMDAQMRHIVDGVKTERDTDDVLHATKAAWRSMANLQKLLEKGQAK